jgi:hypothetical protein
MKLHLYSNVPTVFFTNFDLDVIKKFYTDKLESAQYIVFPVFYEVLFEYSEYEYQKNGIIQEDIVRAKEHFYKLIQLVKSTKQYLVLFYYRDPEVFYNYENVIFFQTSGRKSQKPLNVFGLPAFCNDVLAYLDTNVIQLRTKQNTPSVSFQGLSAPLKLSFRDNLANSFNKNFKVILGNRQIPIYYPDGYLIRRQAMLNLKSNKAIKCDFVTNATKENFATEQEYKLSFIQNMLSCDYGLCVRGFGNYSYRLYEVLSMGRIPVFVNTDCILPFEGFVQWGSHMLEVQESELNDIDKKLLEYHASIHPDDFLQKQLDNRNLWEEYLSFSGFFKKLPEYIKIKYCYE